MPCISMAELVALTTTSAQYTVSRQVFGRGGIVNCQTSNGSGGRYDIGLGDSRHTSGAPGFS